MSKTDEALWADLVEPVTLNESFKRAADCPHDTSNEMGRGKPLLSEEDVKKIEHKHKIDKGLLNRSFVDAHQRQMANVEDIDIFWKLYKKIDANAPGLLKTPYLTINASRMPMLYWRTSSHYAEIELSEDGVIEFYMMPTGSESTLLEVDLTEELSIPDEFLTFLSAFRLLS